MKVLGILFFIILVACLQSCLFRNERLDKNAAFSIVKLSSSDLENYKELRIRLKHDYVAIRKLDSITNGGSFNRTDTVISTNSYYLYKIDSVKYQSILTKLKGKYYDVFWISKSGQAIFELKRYVQKTDNYDTTYSHQLITSTCNCPYQTTLDAVKIYKDSVINPDWKYILSKHLTGW